MRAHHGANYSVPLYLRRNLSSQDILLLPPRSYSRRFFPADQVLWAEPRIIYYMAGPVRTVTLQSPDWESATHAVVIEVQQGGPSVRLVSLKGTDKVKEIRRMYGGAANAP